MNHVEYDARDICFIKSCLLMQVQAAAFAMQVIVAAGIE
jgi:hypothetical protein